MPNDAARDQYRTFVASKSQMPGDRDGEAWFTAGFERGLVTAFSGLDEPRMSDFDRANVGELLNNPKNQTHFSAHLLRLLVRCDDMNLARFALVFPHHVNALQRWRADPNPDRPTCTACLQDCETKTYWNDVLGQPRTFSECCAAPITINGVVQ